MNDINHPTYIELYLNHSLNQNQISKKSPIYNMTYLHFGTMSRKRTHKIDKF